MKPSKPDIFKPPHQITISVAKHEYLLSMEQKYMRFEPLIKAIQEIIQQEIENERYKYNE